ncbi:MAG: hypothetical protein ACFFDT_24430 [Candidatus Hodarchaeota archaeon]
MNFTSASSDLFYPPEGTVSTYRWNFDNFPNICVFNGTHIDKNDYDFDNGVCIENPTYAEFSISYNMSGNFLEEVIDGYMHNATTSLRFQPSFLINISTRLYVNDQGISWEEYTPGYIDPREISVGSQINITLGSINVTAKEIVNVAGMGREAWKLEYNSEFMNQTFFYDTTTGILLSVKFETFEFSIGRSTKPIKHSIHIFNQNNKIISHEQVLISTNAWPTSHTTTFPLFEIILLVYVLTVIIKKNRI